MENFWNFMSRNSEVPFAGVFMLGLCALALIISSCDRHNTRHYTQNGYVQVQKQGTTDTMWVKK